MTKTIVPYHCPRCGYENHKAYNMKLHLYTKKKVCQGIESRIDLTDDVKKEILDNRVYHAPKTSAYVPLVLNLQKELLFYKNRKDEKFFQVVLEDCLNGTQKQLQNGITDITTDSFHAEINEWTNWKGAIGQLLAYNIEDPQPEMQVYFFGKSNKKLRECALQTLTQLNIKAFECIVVNDGVSIVDLVTNNEVHHYLMIND